MNQQSTGRSIMKVLLVNVRIGSGSVGKIVSDLYHGLVKAGHECRIAYGRGGTGDVPVVHTYKICSENEVKIHAGLTRLLGNTAFYFSRTTEKFCEWIDEFKPDIVHLHGVYGYYVNMETLFNYLSRRKIKVVSTLHSCWDFTGHCCYFDYIGCDEWKRGCKSCPSKGSYPASSFLDDTGRNFVKKMNAYAQIDNCVIVTPSDWLATYVRQSFLKQCKIRVINNGIDLNVFKVSSKASKHIDTLRPSIICVANIWDKRKGWADDVELSKLVDESLQLIVVGVTEKQKNELAKHTVAFTRTNDREELAELYSNATVFFNPTYEDNYPTVNLEAAACHTPIVTYDTGGSPEVFHFGDWGQIIEKKDYQALLCFVKMVFRKQINFSFDNVKMLSEKRMVNEYLQLYTEI